MHVAFGGCRVEGVICKVAYGSHGSSIRLTVLISVCRQLYILALLSELGPVRLCGSWALLLQRGDDECNLLVKITLSINVTVAASLSPRRMHGRSEEGKLAPESIHPVFCSATEKKSLRLPMSTFIRMMVGPISSCLASSLRFSSDRADLAAEHSRLSASLA